MSTIAANARRAAALALAFLTLPSCTAADTRDALPHDSAPLGGTGGAGGLPEGATGGSGGAGTSSGGATGGGGAGSAGGTGGGVTSGGAPGSAGATAGLGGLANAGSGFGGNAQAGSSGAGFSGATSGGATNAAGSGGSAGSNDCDSGSAPVDPALFARCTGTTTLECMLGGPAGHYDVTLLLGGASAGSTIVTAEARRFMLAETATPAQGSRCVSFTVNVRIPEGQPIQAVSRGMDGLNLRLAGGAPRLRGLGVVPVTNPVVLYLAGDSTVCDQDPQLDVAGAQRFTGWGQLLPQSFKRGVSVTNYADSGEGTSAFRTDGGSLWARIQAGLKRGDYVFVQLGHNDKTTPAATYRSRILGMITATKNAGATPVLISPMVRNTGDSLAAQHIYGDLNVRSELMALAASQNVAFIDLMAESAAWVARIGRTAAQGYFVSGDSTHSNELGAKVFADFVVAGIRSSSVPVQAYLR